MKKRREPAQKHAAWINLLDVCEFWGLRSLPVTAKNAQAGARTPIAAQNS